MRRATAVFRHLRSYATNERLAPNAHEAVHTHWEWVAPNRMAYQIAGLSDAVVIGTRRWDRDPGKTWQESTIDPLTVPTPTWGTAPAHAFLLGSSRAAGRPVWLASFVQPDVPAWFTIAIDKKTLRTLELWLVAPAHFMHHRYTRFNQRLGIVPPR